MCKDLEKYRLHNRKLEVASMWERHLETATHEKGAIVSFSINCLCVSDLPVDAGSRISTSILRNSLFA